MTSPSSVRLGLVCFILAVAELADGFAPHFLYSLATLSTDSIDHQEVTETAALVALSDYLLGHTHIETINSIRDSATVVRSLFQAYYQFESKGGLELVTRRYHDTVNVIKEANADVDDSEGSLPEAHFDDERILEGNHRLLVKRQTIIDSIRAGRYRQAQKETGRALHTLQDFYSHSNWVELGNTEPWEDLGQPGRVPNNLAGKRVQTCTSCFRETSTGTLHNFFEGTNTKASFEYACKNNMPSTNLITTGYYSHSPDYKKPGGKCSHGGPGDLTSHDPASSGGINKDVRSKLWSPHHYLHDQAADVAIKASVQFLRGIREEVGSQAFGAFLGMDAEQMRFTVSFVIDTALSMREELPYLTALLSRVQQELEDYEASLNNGAVEYVLVHYNDQGSVTTVRARKTSTLIEYIQQGPLLGGEIGARSIFGAMIEAALQAERRGVINVFTDGVASDRERLSELMSIVEDKSLTINVFSSADNNCSHEDTANAQKVDTFDVLSGQSLDLDPVDLSSVHSIIATTFKLTTSAVFQQTGAAGTHTVEFLVDSTMTELQVTVNGDRLTSITLLSPLTEAYDAVASIYSNTTYVATVTISDSSLYGTWTISFYTACPYRVRVVGDTNLHFDYKLHRRTESSILGLKQVKGNVLRGEHLFALISTEMMQATVTMVTVLSSDGSVWTSTILTDAGDGYYHASFKAPALSFQLQIAGVDSNGYQFTRISRTGVDTTDVQITLGPGHSNLPFLVLRPGESKTVSLLLTNFGPTSTFSVKVTPQTDSTGFEYYLHSNEADKAATQTVNLEEGEEKGLDLTVSAHTETLTGSLSLVVVMWDRNSVGRSNFMSIEAISTSLPLVNHTDLMSDEGEGGLGDVLSYGILLITSCLFLGLFTFLTW